MRWWIMLSEWCSFLCVVVVVARRLVNVCGAFIHQTVMRFSHVLCEPSTVPKCYDSTRTSCIFLISGWLRTTSHVYASDLRVVCCTPCICGTRNYLTHVLWLRYVVPHRFPVRISARGAPLRKELLMVPHGDPERYMAQAAGVPP